MLEGVIEKISRINYEDFKFCCVTTIKSRITMATILPMLLS